MARATPAVALLVLAASALLAPVIAEGPPEDCSAMDDSQKCQGSGPSMLQKEGRAAKASLIAEDEQDKAATAAMAAHGSLMKKQNSSICFSCNHGSRKAWWNPACRCHSGWEGTCCDEPATCTQGMAPICPQRKLKEASANCADVSGTGPLTLGTAAMNLPNSLQGLFWLTKQGDSSSLASFGTSKDGHGLSQIDLDPTDGVHIKVRVGGDGVWSFADKASSWGLVEWIDLIYEFELKDANGRAPTNLNDAVEAQIIPYARNLGIRLSWTFLLDFDMKLLRQEEKTKYKNSVVWGRPSSVFGFEVDSAYYDLVQVIDGNGTKLEPAYSDWLAYCDSAESGSTPGKIWYHKYE